MEHGFFSLEGQRGLTEDVSALLQHLSALPEPRLDAAFAGVSTGGGANALLNRPPAATPNKDGFLKAVMEVTELVAKAGPPGGTPAGAGRPAGASAGPALGPLNPEQIALLIAARDFLAILARPATVESIRITREYGRSIWLHMIGEMLWQPVRRLIGRSPPEPPDGAAARRSARFGAGLAMQVGAWQIFTVGLVVLTVLLSIYALVGRGLVQEVNVTNAHFTVLATDMEEAERVDAPVFITFFGVGGDGGAQMPGPYIQRYCDAIRRTQEGDRFATRQHQKLCDRFDGYSQALERSFLRLRSWHSQAPGRWFPIADVCRPGQVWQVASDKCVPDTAATRPAPTPGEPSARLNVEAATSTGVQLAAAPGGETATGASPTVASATGGGATGVAGGGPEGDPATSGSAAKLLRIQHLRSELVTSQVILQAITEYLLPCMFAMLGALAAVLGTLARRAEDATLTFSDGSVIFRTLVLGLLFGAVIGLFSSQIAPGVQGAEGGAAAASLTPAALSLLAGYSVAQVFQFFDGLSLRVFGPRSPAGTPTG